MSEPSANSFLKLVEKSGIVEPENLKPAIASAKDKAQQTGNPITATSMADHLIDCGLITKWQSEKFLAGKYKGFFLGKFKLLGHLGSGGMSSVYLARHKISNQLRAIKVLPRKKVADKSYLDRFYLEARIAASLNDPNVVRIYDICDEGGVHFMVMEYVKGEDLLELVNRTGPLKFADAARYVIEACEGLKHAHEKELVHRDIKPANLLLNEQQDVKILDLGLALVNQDDSESLTVLYNEKVMGTADYLSPEQAVNSHGVDLRADIYSLGCTMYFLLVGHPPFPKGTLAQRIAAHQTKSPVPLDSLRADVPPLLQDIIETMMRKDPDERLQTCEEVQASLQHFLTSEDIPDSVNLLTPEDDELEKATGIDPSAGHAIKNPGVSSAKGSKVPPLETVNIRTETRESKSGQGQTKEQVAPAPKWLLPALIGGMFLALALILAIVIYVTQ
jgi:serine/threonine-protein kinase